MLRVSTAAASWVVPPHRAVWVPAGIPHAEQMFAPVSVRTLYFAPRTAKTLPRECGTLNISSLLRELILHVSRIGALDRRIPWQARLIAVLLDQMTEVSEVPLQLPLPRDARALRFASLMQETPGDAATVAALARRAGASRRTIERLFAQETGMTVAEWRRRLRLLHAVRLLAEGRAGDDRVARSRLLERQRVHRRVQARVRRDAVAFPGSELGLQILDPTVAARRIEHAEDQPVERRRRPPAASASAARRRETPRRSPATRT